MIRAHRRTHPTLCSHSQMNLDHTPKSVVCQRESRMTSGISASSQLLKRHRRRLNRVVRKIRVLRCTRQSAQNDVAARGKPGHDFGHRPAQSSRHPMSGDRVADDLSHDQTHQRGTLIGRSHVCHHPATGHLGAVPGGEGEVGSAPHAVRGGKHRLRRRCARGPWPDGRPGWRVRPACSSEPGSRDSSHDGGCWAGTCAS